jgi:hypothetical protein
MLNSILNFIIRKPVWSLIAFLIIVCTSAIQIQNFSLDASSESLSLEGDNNLELYFATQETFGSDESLVISYSVNNGTVLSKDHLTSLRSLRDDLLELEGVSSVTSILDVSLFQSPPLSLVELVSDVYTIENGKADRSLIAKEFKNSPLYANNLVSEDLKTTALLIPLATDDPRILIDDELLEILIKNIRMTMDAYRDNASLYLGGVPMIRNDVIDFIKSDYKKISGGLLVQDKDLESLNPADMKCVTASKPSESEMKDLLFAWKVAKYVKSNAIVYAKNQMTIGVGAGQMSRIYSAKIAGIKAADENLEVQGSVMASDAFFPFRDGIDAAAQAGIKAIIHPGGSMRDDEVIAAANEHGIAMIFTYFSTPISCALAKSLG